jgi:hypothetical protein
MSGGRPLVGYVSSRNTLAVAERHDRTVVTVNAGTRAMLLFGGVVLGPAFAAFFLLAPHRFTRMPFFIQAAVVLTILGMTYVLLRTLFVRPTLELLANGDVVVHHPNRTIPRAAIRAVAIETDTYTDPPRYRVDNAVLVVHTTDGHVRLTASPDKALIERLATRLRSAV